jgi:hypothetical protein
MSSFPVSIERRDLIRTTHKLHRLSNIISRNSTCRSRRWAVYAAGGSHHEDTTNRRGGDTGRVVGRKG